MPVATIGASFGSALEAIWGNRWRSLPTTLGIFIGVAAVIAVVTLTQGVNSYITNSISSRGTNTIIVFPGTTQNRGASQGSSTGQSLTLSDEQSLVGLPHVASVSPVLVVSAQAIYGNEHWSTTISGTSVDDQIIQNWTVAQGDWFTQQDDQHGLAVAVIGDTVAHNLFDATNTNPIGQKIGVRDQIFTVIGVLAAKGQGQDDVIYVPFNTAHLRLKNVTSIDQILVMADTTDSVPRVQQNIADQLAKDHHQKDPSTYDFQVLNFAQVLQGTQQQTAVTTFLLVAIAAISLTMGGIGIMNAMLVSVTERTREIALLMAVGARRSDIRNQFLVEAFVLCLIGAGPGLLLGLLMGWGLAAFFGMPLVVTPTTILVPVGVSLAITLIFGIYPAMRATLLNHISSPEASLTMPPSAPAFVPEQQFTPENTLQEFRVCKAKLMSRTKANFAHAIEAVWANRTRSLLTMLVIFIGVTAVVTVCILTQGASTYFTNQVLSEGVNAITIDPGITSTPGLSRKTAGRSLTFQAFQEVRKLPHVTTSSPILYSEAGQAVYGKQSWKTNGRGVSADYQNIASWDMAEGLWFSDADNASVRPVVIIGDTVYQHLFVPLNIDPIGKTITYQGQPFKIIGVLAPRGGFDRDDILYFPYNTVRYRLSKDPTNVDEIIVQADSADTVDQAVRAIQFSLERSHHIAKGTPDDFTITTADQLLQQAQQETSALTVLLVGSIAIALIVGGIGVMNIMIVSVTERTREIGICMSIGAKRSDIRSQFLIEALVLCLVGGAFGLLVGLAAGYKAATGFGFPFVTTWLTFSLPFAVSSIVGLAFGLVPAMQASRLDPITALRRANQMREAC